MKSAFTVIELLVVAVIIAVLVGLAVPAYTYVLQMGRATGCVSNLRQIGVALNLYLADHNATMPALQAARSSVSDNVPVIDNTLNRYAGDPRVFACPADTAGLASTTGTSYFWNSALNNQVLANLQFLAISALSRIPLLSDKQGFHPYIQNKVNMLYADGHATKDLNFFTSP